MQITKDNKTFYDIPEYVMTEHGRYDLVEHINSGGNSTVWECIDYNGQSYAIKFQLNLKEKNLKRFGQEVKIHSELVHPHFVRYIDSGEINATEQYKNSTRQRKIPFIIMEKADMNLLEFIREHGEIIYTEYIHQFLGLSEALALLHEKAVHRDIKLENVLVVGDRWVISDFGLCSFLDEEEHEDITGEKEKVGPKYWMSPEAINRIYDSNVEIVKASDVFQLSAVFWFVATLEYPLGILSLKDWKSEDSELCEVLLEGLLHDVNDRIQDGKNLNAMIHSVVNKYRNAD